MQKFYKDLIYLFKNHEASFELNIILFKSKYNF